MFLFGKMGKGVSLFEYLNSCFSEDGRKCARLCQKSGPILIFSLTSRCRGKRDGGRPCFRWLDEFKNVCNEGSLKLREIEVKCIDRKH